MKRAICTAFLAIILPVAAFASSSSIVFSNRGGKVVLSAGQTTFGISNSTLVSFTNFNGLTSKGNVGTVSFTTGALNSGSLGLGGTFAAGGMFKIVGNGHDGIASGTLFTGTFTGPTTWTSNGGESYTLSGLVSGKMSNGMVITNAKVQLQFGLSQHLPQTARLRSGTFTVVVPEPSTLALLGTGALGIAGLVRRKIKM
ncbi:MAG: PEP-CTERM sorting domain-containing protein [Acidobacteriota bacterium]|nr:PEP-CTERM sorting domain-containing protein [Acidobacteriota bacterium]